MDRKKKKAKEKVTKTQPRKVAIQPDVAAAIEAMKDARSAEPLYYVPESTYTAVE